MKTQFLSILIASSIILSPTLRADSAMTEPAVEHLFTSASQEPMGISPSLEEEGATVSAREDNNLSAAKKKQWFNIFLSAAAVVIAVTAMILVAHNDGHKA